MIVFLAKIILSIKLVLKCCWNLLQGLISPTSLLDPFTGADPKSAKRQSSHQCFFAFWDLRAKKQLIEC